MSAHYPYDEKALLLRLAAGDQEAYQAIYDVYWGQVYGVAMRLTKSPEQSKDLSQDIFFKLWINREQLLTVIDLRRYLYTISRNLVYDFLRRKVFIESNRAFLEEYLRYEPSSPQEIAEQKSRGEALQAAIDSMPPKLREVFRLHRIEGLSHDMIARQLNISPLSSKTYMVRALAFLRDKFAGSAGNF
jgi:RNA polymerase sigma-70 factor (family 1)